MGAAGVIVVASDRNDPLAARLRLYRLETGTARLVALGSVPGGAGEAYGVCLWRTGAELHAFSVLKDGTVEQIRLDFSGSEPAAVPVRRLKLATQTEGCVADPRDGTLYVGEENVGIWRFASGAQAGTLVAPADGRQLVADVEGLALVPMGETGGYLVASSQGDNAYALFALPGMTPAGRFRIGPGRFGATEETDGIDLVTGDFGADYPGGLFVAQDGRNAPFAQNFKFVPWQAIRSVMETQETLP
jgi:3-phytase